MNTKLHAVTDTLGRPIRFFMTAGQVSDYTGARALVSNLPAAEWLLGDRGYDADWFREALVNIGIKPCIPGRKSRSKAIKYDKRRYKKRNRIEIMFGRLKDWRRVATRYDRCPKVFMSAIALAATVPGEKVLNPTSKLIKSALAYPLQMPQTSQEGFATLRHRTTKPNQIRREKPDRKTFTQPKTAQYISSDSADFLRVQCRILV